MQPGATHVSCPVCRTKDVAIHAIVHHLICAYVGPDYDFEHGESYRCPKCLRALRDHDASAEITGTGARCRLCGTEFVVPHGAVQDE
jgi:DNA-directed RNA polymerase subunit RPC12/RpoP